MKRIILGTTILALAGACVELSQGQGEAAKWVNQLRGSAVEFTFHSRTDPNYGSKDNGVEYFLKETNETIYQDGDGTCKAGTYRVDGNFICFKYPSESTYEHCFTVFELDGQLVTSSDQTDLAIYQVANIVGSEPTCTP